MEVPCILAYISVSSLTTDRHFSLCARSFSQKSEYQKSSNARQSDLHTHCSVQGKTCFRIELSLSFAKKRSSCQMQLQRCSVLHCGAIPERELGCISARLPMLSLGKCSGHKKPTQTAVKGLHFAALPKVSQRNVKRLESFLQSCN